MIVAREITMSPPAKMNGAKPKPETWRDWMPPGSPEPDPLLTREEFLDQLRERGVELTPSALIHWERVGALPRAIRRWHAGAPRALYPPWMVPLAASVRDKLEDGVSLREVGARLRQQAESAEWPRQHALTTVQPGTAVASGGTVTATIIDPVAGALDTAIAALTRRYLHATGANVARVEVHLEDEHGHTRTVVWPRVSE